MKMAALGIVVFGLLTGIYASAVVVPKYRAANSAWLSAPRDSSNRDQLESRRGELRKRGQMYGMSVIALGVIGLGLSLASRKKPGFPPGGLLIAGSVLTLATFGIIQGIGDVF